MKEIYSLEFDELYFYNILLVGITLPVKLIYRNVEAEVAAKIAAGASHCIFERVRAENLGEI